MVMVRLSVNAFIRSWFRLRVGLNPYTCKPGVLLWDIDKQNSPRCDATIRGVPSGDILFAYLIFIEN